MKQTKYKRKQIEYDFSLLENKKVLIVEDKQKSTMITASKGVICVIDNGEDSIKAVKKNITT
jgi:hypothetical protein